MNSRYPYILAIILGLIIPFVGEIEPYPITLCLIYLVGGGLIGFLWPKESWRWGLWIAGPMVFFLVLSVVFAGQLEMFFKKDLPILLLAIISACLGSFLSATFKRSRSRVTEK